MRLIAELSAWRLGIASLLAAILLPPFSARKARAMIYRIGGVDLPAGCEVGGKVVFGHRNVTLGRGVYVGPGTWFTATAEAGVVVGDRTAIGPRCHFITTTHEFGDSDRRAAAPKSAAVRVGRGVWIGADVTVLPGVHIGDGSVIAAGSVVTSDVGADTLVAGVPAQRRRQLGSPPPPSP